MNSGISSLVLKTTLDGLQPFSCFKDSLLHLWIRSVLIEIIFNKSEIIQHTKTD